MNKYSEVKSISFLLFSSIVVVLGTLVTDTRAAGQSATWSQLFQANCNGVGGCQEDCYNGGVGSTCVCAQGTASQWFTATTGASPSIQISAAASGQAYCRTVNTQNTCQFNLGDGGVTQVKFDFLVTSACSQATAQGTEWLSFWIFNNPWNGQSEVDFIESRNGPGPGLNTNFDAHGNQVVIFPAGPATWSGNTTTTFSGTGNAVSVSVSNNQNSNVGTTTLNSSTGYFFAMDTAGGSNNSSCSITVSNLSVTGKVPSTLNGNPNCVGLPITGN
jgi:hypothetical protein